MKQEISCEWKGGMAFEADVYGQKVAMDVPAADGGADSGARPKPMVLAALAGCTGMDVVSILKKMRESCTYFNILVEAETTEEHPKRFTAFKVVYEFKASDGLNEDNVKKAVTLSQEKYCGVSATLQAAAPVEWEIVYL